MRPDVDPGTGDLPPRGRLILGGLILIGGQLSPLAIAFVASSSLPVAWKSALSGVLLLGVPELSIVVSAAVLGKSGFTYVKGRIFAAFKRLAPPDTVTATRYHIGLVLFVIPWLAGWLLAYFSDLIPNFERHRITINLSLDLMLLISLLVLGGDFWEKLKALFIHGARVQFPLDSSSSHPTGKV